MKKSVRIGFIGCGKFVSMFLSQYNQLKKIEINTIVDIKTDQIITLNDVELNLPKEVLEAREYQYNLI